MTEYTDMAGRFKKMLDVAGHDQLTQLQNFCSYHVGAMEAMGEVLRICHGSSTEAGVVKVKAFHTEVLAGMLRVKQEMEQLLQLQLANYGKTH